MFCTSTRGSSQLSAMSRQASATPASPVQRPGEGPSAITYSISGCAHSAELKSPRSQAAQSERTRSRFDDDTNQVSRCPGTFGAQGLSTPAPLADYCSLLQASLCKPDAQALALDEPRQHRPRTGTRLLTRGNVEVSGSTSVRARARRILKLADAR